MPRIPQYTARYDRPSGTGMVPVSAVPDPLSGIGESIVSVAGVASRELEKRAERRRVVEFSTLAADFERELTNDYINYTSLQGKDAYGSQERLAGLEKKALEKYKSNDPVVNGRLALYIRDNITGKMVAYNAHETQEDEYEMRLTDARTLDAFKESAARGSGSLQENTDKYTAFVSTLVSNNSISEEEGTAKILKGTRDITLSTLKGMVARNPSSVVDQIKSGIWSDKLPADTLAAITEDARREEDRQQRIRDANELLVKKNNEESARKRLQDLSSRGVLTTAAVDSEVDNLSATQYEKWKRLDDTRILNLAKDVDVENAITIEAEYGSRIMSEDGIVSVEDFNNLKDELSEKVATKELSLDRAQKIVKYAEKNLSESRVEKKRTISLGIESIKKAHSLGFYGHSKSKSSLVIRDKAINGLLAWVEEFPTGDTNDYLKSVLYPPAGTTKRTGRLAPVWNIFYGKDVPVSEDVARKRMFGLDPEQNKEEEFTAEQARRIMKSDTAPKQKVFSENLPSLKVLKNVILSNKFTKKNELIDYMRSQYGMTVAEAVEYIGGLK